MEALSSSGKLLTTVNAVLNGTWVERKAVFSGNLEMKALSSSGKLLTTLKPVLNGTWVERKAVFSGKHSHSHDLLITGTSFCFR
jgi:hypothetical protein